MEIHDTRGHINPKTVVVSGGNDTLSISGKWNDGGLPLASIPEFVRRPVNL